VGRLTALIVMSALLVACQTASQQPVASPTPSPSPHTPASAAVLQASEVPTGLAACPGSGPVDTYVSSLQTTNAVLAIRIAGQWQALQSLGAVEASISLFTSDPTACTAELGAVAKIKSTASFVARFADDGQADRAWQAGVLGFAPPAPDLVAPGIKRGTDTGLGSSSWTYDRQPVRLACWRRSVFVALVVLTNLDASAFKSATGAVDARLN